MVVGDVVFQAVDIVHVHAVAEFLYFVQQELARGIVQNIVQCVVCHGAEREQGGFVEVAHHVFVVSPGGHLLDALHGFVGIAAVFGEQVGADKYVGIRFFAVDDAAAVGTFEVSLTFGFALAALYETVPFVSVEPYAGWWAGRFLSTASSAGGQNFRGLFFTVNCSVSLHSVFPSVT